MPIIFANADSGVVYPLRISKAAGVTLNFSFLTDNATDDVSGDTWNLEIKDSAGTAKVTLTSGSGLTISGANIEAVVTTSNLSSVASGGYTWSLNDTTSGRTRIQGDCVITA